MQVNRILQRDAKCRFVGIEGDLFTLHDLSETSTWNYEMPTLVNHSNEYIRKNIIRNNDVFKKNFFEKFCFLNKINLSHLFVAGGCIRSLMMNQTINDVDIFVYGITDPKLAIRRIENFIIDIYQHIMKLKNGSYIEKELKEFKKRKIDDKNMYQENSKFEKDHENNYRPTIDTDIEVYYNGHTVTLYVNRIKVQIILRLYNTISEILHGFDLGSSAVGFDGNLVYLTTLSKFCFENLVNIVDCSRRSTTYEIRLIKYFENGFSLILPNLDISKLRTSYHKYNIYEVCELPFLIFSYTKINGNSIYVNKFHQESGHEVNSDYDFYGNLNYDDSNYELLHYNIGQLTKGTHKFVRTINLNSEVDVLLSKKISLDLWRMDFNGLPVEFDFIEKLYNGMMNNLISQKINLETIRKFINVVDIKTFVNDVYLSNLTSTDKKAKISNIINQQKQWFKTQLDEFKICSIEWIVENPMTQLTSSINPIIGELNDWYGACYLFTENIILEDDFDPNNRTNIIEYQQQIHNNFE
jgi:hypothetical protein